MIKLLVTPPSHDAEGNRPKDNTKLQDPRSEGGRIRRPEGEGMKNAAKPTRRCAKGCGHRGERSPKRSDPSGIQTEVEKKAAVGRTDEGREVDRAHVQGLVRSIVSRCNPLLFVDGVMLIDCP